MNNLYQDSLNAMEHLHKTISSFVQSRPNVAYTLEALYGNSPKVMHALRTALSSADTMAIANEHGATVSMFKLGELRIQDRTPPRHPPTWAVCDASGNCLSKSGRMDYEPLPSSRSYEWLRDHRWNSADEAIKAASEYVKSAAKAQQDTNLAALDDPF